MSWTVELHPLFAEEFSAFSKLVKRELLSEVEFLEQFGPALSRPHADTLKNSKHANMKELRFNADDGVWRLAFAFDPERKAILLVAGDKSGASSQKFYKVLLKKADRRFDDHLKRLKEKKS
jgi:hypothetical protein